jgi:hypothetical protein
VRAGRRWEAQRKDRTSRGTQRCRAGIGDGNPKRAVDHPMGSAATAVPAVWGEVEGTLEKWITNSYHRAGPGAMGSYLMEPWELFARRETWKAATHTP